MGNAINVHAGAWLILLGCTALLALTPTVGHGSPGYQLRDPAVTGVPATPEPDIDLSASGQGPRERMRHTDFSAPGEGGVLKYTDKKGKKKGAQSPSPQRKKRPEQAR